MRTQRIAASLLLLAVSTEAAKILAFLPIPAKSHFGAYSPYLEELAKRGHEVTVVSPFPRKAPLGNYTDIVLEDSFPPRDSKDFNLFERRDAPFFVSFFFIFNICYESCERVLQMTNMQKLMQSTDLHFDLVLYEPFFTECTYGILHKFKAPTIQLVPNTIIPWTGNPVGNPSTTSYVPVLLMEREKMDFWGRMSNFLRTSFFQLFRRFYVIPKMDALMRKYFPDPTLPGIEEIERASSFLFLHSHPVLNYPRPLTPNTIEVGGLHVKDATRLPQDLQAFLDEAAHGAVYFSLGSNVRSVDLPAERRDALVRAFARLPQRVLWKWEAGALPGRPRNVRLGAWLPQHAILAHPNTKVFVTHGGLMSTQEATFFGVPLVAVPILADQKFNAIRAQNSGYAVHLDFANLTEEAVTWAINEVLNEPRYRANAQRLSAIFTDQPQKPLERAVWWTEYALRHGGAPHLRSAALDLGFAQRHLLDVAGALLGAAAAAAAALCLCLRAALRRCRAPRPRPRPAPAPGNTKKTR